MSIIMILMFKLFDQFNYIKIHDYLKIKTIIGHIK
jgi:hypothetical protein